MNRDDNRYSGGDRNQSRSSGGGNSYHNSNSSYSTKDKQHNTTTVKKEVGNDSFNSNETEKAKSSSLTDNGGTGDQSNMQSSAAAKSTHSYPQSHNDSRKKFTGRCRLFFGNIPLSLTEEEFNNIIKPYGETEDLFLNAKKGFGFVKLETRAAAEACKNGLDGMELQNRSLRVRYATHSAALQVKNLTQHCTNESLEQAFSIFGTVERAVVVVDDRGKSQGTGIVEFSRRASYLKALETISNGVFLVSKSMRPVCVEPLEQKDEEDGLPEKYAQKTQEWFEEMGVSARIAEPGSFEYDVGMKWKELEQLEAEKKKQLEDEMSQKRLEMELEVESMVHEHKANMLRQDMMRRQAELNALEAQRKQREEQKLRELEMRRMQMNQQQKNNQMNMGGANQMNMGGANQLNMSGANQMNMGGANQMGMSGANQMNLGGPNQANRMGGGGNQMNRVGSSSSSSLGVKRDGDFSGGKQSGGFGGNTHEILMHQQQQVLREQQMLRERQIMQLRQQHQHGGASGVGGGQGNRVLQPPPNPPQYMNESGRNNGPGHMGRGMGGGPDNFGGMHKGGGQVRPARFDQGPPRNVSQGMQRHPGPSLLGPNPRGATLNNFQHLQQQNRMFNERGPGPTDAKRPRRY